MNNLWHVIVLFFASKQWMPIAIIAIAYLVRLTSDQSKFPVFVAARWRPMIVIALAQVYAILPGRACMGSRPRSGRWGSSTFS
jgi:undecaprenyl pyrophosphate phosphatase UppP